MTTSFNLISLLTSQLPTYDRFVLVCKASSWIESFLDKKSRRRIIMTNRKLGLGKGSVGVCAYVCLCAINYIQNDRMCTNIEMWVIASHWGEKTFPECFVTSCLPQNAESWVIMGIWQTRSAKLWAQCALKTKYVLLWGDKILVQYICSLFMAY